MGKRATAQEAQSGLEKLGGSAFATVVDEFVHDARVSRGGRFGSISLRVDGKVFVMFTKGELVAKLPAERVAELVAAGTAAPYRTGGRQMREWAALSDYEEQWAAISREAYAFVGG